MKANLDKNLAPAWVSGKSYSTGEFCLYNKRLYICTTDNSDAEFDNSKWERRNLVDLVSGINSNLMSIFETDFIQNTTSNVQSIDVGFIPKKVIIFIKYGNAYAGAEMRNYETNEVCHISGSNAPATTINTTNWNTIKVLQDLTATQNVSFKLGSTNYQYKILAFK